MSQEPRNVALVEWDAASARARAERLEAAGFEVWVESQDGTRAYREIKKSLPAAVIVVLTPRPSHGIETAASLRSLKATRRIPVIFVDGDQAAREKAGARVAGAGFTSSAELLAALGGMIRADPDQKG